MRKCGSASRILRETISIKKKYCVLCKHYKGNTCSIGRVARECWRKRRRECNEGREEDESKSN